MIISNSKKGGIIKKGEFANEKNRNFKDYLFFSIVLILSACQKNDSTQIIEETLDTSKSEESSEQKVMNKGYGVEDDNYRDTSSEPTSITTYIPPYPSFNEISQDFISDEVIIYQ